MPGSGAYELVTRRGARPEWRCALSDAHLVGCTITGGVCDTRAAAGPFALTNVAPRCHVPSGALRAFDADASFPSG